ncbi:hypothetical protein BN2475_100069 [Paraburkholderia ribeironis]|uniref:Uncharacterized protein n=1 Tax=Paraburkholderia ribeironis TaxID=1247936 RepID=A0A1N7RPF1_9BURK|nr:hypothetical protein BN2475_100069 [Paraburkholderia ribeironis]
MSVVLAWSTKYTRSLPGNQRARPSRASIRVIPTTFFVFRRQIRAFRTWLAFGVAARDACGIAEPLRTLRQFVA